MQPSKRQKLQLDNCDSEKETSICSSPSKSGQQNDNDKESKVFHDPIHGLMEFHPFLVKIIDTPQFQRLRNIKQLGGGYFVYPGASHNRFEHSLGVAHLAGQLVRSLKEKLNVSDIDERDILCVEIAGLCHDLGHGPFSHMFDGMFIPKVAEASKSDVPSDESSSDQPLNPENYLSWKHEKASVEMFEYIVQTMKERGFDLKEKLTKMNEENKGDDMQFIKEMILGPDELGQYKGRPRTKSFLYEIISNKRSGLDVDKFDYFARDCYHLGLKNSFDHHRFIHFAKVVEVDGELQICTRDKELPNIYEMFHTRCRLHQKAYQHKTNKIVELMITEALFKANGSMNISKKIQDMKDYAKLNDSVFEQILYSTDDKLKEAREILENVLSRKLYTYLGRTKMTEMPKVNEALKKKWKKELANTKVDIPKDERKLTEEDFEIFISDFNFGMKEKNPVENLHFYSKFDDTKAFKIPSHQVSQFLLPQNFSEKWINVCCKSLEKKDQRVAYRHFYEWCFDKGPVGPPNLLNSKEFESQPKVFNDPIHGHITFQPKLLKIIDTNEFQKLRFIKKLGIEYLVYPGASHNCFEHALGVAHLAGKLVRTLQKKQPDLEVTEKDVLCVEIAGLSHDLGHEPFSQEFDDQKRTESAALCKQILDQLDLDLDEKDKIFIQEMIRGIKTEETPEGRSDKRFLYDIVNNQRNGVDMKLFDSVARDSYHLGIKTNFDHNRFIKFARVLEVKDMQQICVRDKILASMCDLAYTWNSLHYKAYKHKVTMKIKLMMSDVMKEKPTEADKRQMTDYSLFVERSTDDLQTSFSTRAKALVENLNFREFNTKDEVSQQAGTNHIFKIHFYDKKKELLSEMETGEKMQKLLKLD